MSITNYLESVKIIILNTQSNMKMDSFWGADLALKSGTPGATRTRDTRFRKPLLYPPELQGHI